MSTSIGLSHFPFINRLLLGDFFGVGLEVCPLVLLVHLARFVVVLKGSPFPITDLKPGRTPVAIFGSLGVCIYGPASRHWLISYSAVHLT